MFHQILDLSSIFIRQTITGCIRNVHDSGTCFNDSFYHTGQIFIFSTPGIFTIKLNIIHILTSIFSCSNRSFNNFFSCRIKFILNMRIRSSDTRMDTRTLSKLQSFSCNINIFFYCTSQSTNRGPSHSFRNLNYTLKITWT